MGGMFIVLILVLSSFFTFSILNTLNESIYKTKFKGKYELSFKVLSDDPTTTHKNIEEMEKVLIKSCREMQSYILTCRECYLAGNTYCPYPTDSFCQQVANLDEHNTTLIWSFLPNTKDYLYKTQSLTGIKPEDAKNADDLPKIIDYKLSHTIDYSILDKTLKYNKPTDNNLTDPCAVEGVVNK